MVSLLTFSSALVTGRSNVKPSVLLVLLAFSRALVAGQSNVKPNVLLVLADDLGWSNLGNRAGSVNGSATPSEAQTPNIDELVSSGIRLNRHYTYNYCSPSRASLQSGRLPVHVSFNNDDPTTYNPGEPDTGFAGIPRNMTGIAEKMKSAGYKTHMTGKWDAGMATWRHTPMGRVRAPVRARAHTHVRAGVRQLLRVLSPRERLLYADPLALGHRRRRHLLEGGVRLWPPCAIRPRVQYVHRHRRHLLEGGVRVCARARVHAGSCRG